MAESLRSLQRRLEEASRREAEAAAQSDAAARSIRGAAEELRKERDAEREGRRAAEGRAEALEKEVGELKGAVEAGVKERRLLVERLDEAERVGREERERYRETLGALKEQVSKVRRGKRERSERRGRRCR